MTNKGFHHELLGPPFLNMVVTVFSREAAAAAAHAPAGPPASFFFLLGMTQTAFT